MCRVDAGLRYDVPFSFREILSMRILAVAFMLAVFTVIAVGQAPASRPAAATRAPKPAGTLAQVMRGIYFPNANLIFDVQQNDPGVAKKTSGEPAGSATEKYGNAYTGWETVENAAVALTDGVDLILKPGRTCQNGKPVPVQRADFQKFARDMRQAGIAVLQAARTKNQEKVSDATNNIADACSNCHEVYRDKGPADSPARCSPPAK
jgi:cytochrome c553